MGNMVFAKNLKRLRKAYGESQQDLALAIDQGPTSISNYEREGRVPDTEVLQKIATHYRIPVESLLTAELDIINRSAKSDINIEMLAKFNSEIFPLTSSNKALENDLFLKAYNKHLEWIKMSEKGMRISENDFCSLIDLYSDCSEKYELKEAICNLLGILLQCEYVIQNPQLVDSVIALKQGMKYGEYQQRFILRDMGIGIKDSVNVEDVQNIEESILELLKEIKYTEYSELADYYIALRYITGCRSLAENIDLCRTFGEDYMLLLAELDNKYAISFIIARRNFINN